jgi:hypothetical protein
MGRARK